jgi:hypothetical protein
VSIVDREPCGRGGGPPRLEESPMAEYIPSLRE